MVAARVHRHALEVLAAAPVAAQMPRQEAEVAFADDGAVEARVHRHALEALVAHPPTVQMPRQEAEVAFSDEGTVEARVHRAALEVLAESVPAVQLNRQEAEVAFLDEGGAGGSVRVHRHALEILARAGVPPPTPIAMPAGLDVFLHNWATTLDLETSYLTDISRSPTTGAEERIALLQRPARLLKPRFLRESKAEVDRLLVQLRRLTQDNLVFPLLMDAVVLTANSGTLQRNLFYDPRFRRYFNGGRLAIFPVAGTHHLDGNFDVYSIVSVLPDRVVVERDLDQLYPGGAFAVVPCIDVEKLLQPSWRFLTDRVLQADLDLSEIVGPGALPPSFTGDTPDGWLVQLGLPVFEIDPDWAEGLEASALRYGDVVRSGRKDVVTPHGSRAVHVQPFNLKFSDRADFWRFLQFFDSRRGRAGAFWEVDHEYLWTVTDTDPQFIDVTPLGVFADFQAGFTEHCGIVMNDGTVYVRKINTIQTLGGSWRLSLVAGNNLPNIDVTQIRRFSRARVKRFDSDAMLERWLTNTVCETSVTTIEVLNEKEVEL